MQPDQPTPAMLAAARAYTEATWDYLPDAYVEGGRQAHIDADALSTAQAPWFAALWAASLAEGRRQATEGWERHWGVRFEDVDDVQRFATEASARQLAGASDTVMARLVGPWEPAEQHEEAQHG